MLKTFGIGLLARLLSYGILALGFWLLFQAFVRPSFLMGVLGAAMIPLGMYLMVTARRASILPKVHEPTEDKEEESVDSFSGSR